jgi:protein SDA1
LQKLREEDGLDLDQEDDDAMWQGWDIESTDEDEDSDEDEDWINVDGDEDEPLVISDTEDENEKAKNDESPNPPRISTLATSKVSLKSRRVYLFIFMYFLDINTRRFCTPQRPSDTSCY